jgi:hypothetical protein
MEPRAQDHVADLELHRRELEDVDSAKGFGRGGGMSASARARRCFDRYCFTARPPG